MAEEVGCEAALLAKPIERERSGFDGLQEVDEVPVEARRGDSSLRAEQPDARVLNARRALASCNVVVLPRRLVGSTARAAVTSSGFSASPTRRNVACVRAQFGFSSSELILTRVPLASVVLPPFPRTAAALPSAGEHGAVYRQLVNEIRSHPPAVESASRDVPLLPQRSNVSRP